MLAHQLVRPRRGALSGRAGLRDRGPDVVAGEALGLDGGGDRIVVRARCGPAFADFVVFAWDGWGTVTATSRPSARATVPMTAMPRPEPVRESSSMARVEKTTVAEP